MNRFDLLQQVALFNGMDVSEIESVLNSISAGEKKYKAGEIIFREGDTLRYAGIVLEGCVQVVREDYYGNRDIIGQKAAPGLFGEALCFSGAEKIPVSIYAIEDSRVLMLKLKGLDLPQKLQANLLSAISVKVLELTNKIRIIQKKTTAEKLMSFLRLESRKSASDEFDITFSRQELADYLGVDRSAMIVELRKLKAQGRIDVKGKHFRLYSG